MCDVIVPIALAAVSAASQVSQYAGQSANAQAQQNFENSQYTQVRQSATANYLQQVSQIQNRTIQDTAATQDQARQDMQAGNAAKAHAATLMGERGVEGNSVTESLHDFDRIESQNQLNLLTNLNWRKQQAYQDELTARAQAQDRIAGATPQPVVFPSAAALGVGLAGTALQTYDKISYATKTGIYATPSSPASTPGVAPAAGSAQFLPFLG